MSSIIPGYKYDIFISYRQKNNKHDGWVTDFVHNLKGELEATFKENISVYFDTNAQDGLLETYDVDASLKALEEIRITEQQLINNSECIFTKANIYRRSGEWSLAEENYLKAYEIDPGSPIITENIGETFYLTGKFQEAEKYFNMSLILNPTFMDAYWLHSKMYMKWQGNTVQARKTMAEASKFEGSSSNMNLFELNVLLDIYDGNYQRALNTLSANSINIIDDQFYFHPKSLLYARVYSLMKMPDKAHEYFDSARITIESRILKDPDDPRLYSAAGFAYAGLGQKEKAISAGEKALELMPVNKEAYRGTFRAEDLAMIYVMVGKYDAALKQIKILLTVPSDLSVKMILLDPDWKPLWSLPEFKKITNTSLIDADRKSPPSG
jgi:tetratricopeptide (TPR) repeat protein